MENDQILRIGIAGCTGRMGLSLLRAVEERGDLQLAGGTVRAGSEKASSALLARQGEPEVRLFTQPADLAAVSDVLIDFTTPSHTLEIASAAAAASIPLVCGTTGLTEFERDRLLIHAGTIPLLLTGNSSLGVTIFAALVEETAARLDTDYDIEIVEMHHRHKKDAPSGTALLLGEAAAKGRGRALADLAVFDRSGPRPHGSIGFASLRGGDVVGEHRVIFAGDGERFELVHRATDRRIFSDGAIKAARWLVEQTPGFYSMRDMLGFKNTAN